jgi:Tfp pilus assembly protein PilX
LRSIRSFSRARTTERGFALVAALGLAILYFGLMELILIDSSRALVEAQRFRARVVAASLAEDAAELAATRMREHDTATMELNGDDRQLRGKLTRNGDNFEIIGEATAIGAMKQSATVRVQGRMGEDGIVHLDYTMHGQ